MIRTNLAETYASFGYLRSVCKHFEERLMLGEAIRQGWPASAIENEARSLKSRTRARRETRHLMAIQGASKRRYVSPEERKASLMEFREAQAARDARDAIKATKATRPAVPSNFKSIRAACRSMLDVDHLVWALAKGWQAEDITFLARCHSLKNKDTPAAIRMALFVIQGHEAGHYSPYLPAAPTQDILAS